MADLVKLKAAARALLAVIDRSFSQTMHMNDLADPAADLRAALGLRFGFNPRDGYTTGSLRQVDSLEEVAELGCEAGERLRAAFAYEPTQDSAPGEPLPVLRCAMCDCEMPVACQSCAAYALESAGPKPSQDSAPGDVEAYRGVAQMLMYRLDRELQVAIGDRSTQLFEDMLVTALAKAHAAGEAEVRGIVERYRHGLHQGMLNTDSQADYNYYQSNEMAVRVLLTKLPEAK